MQGRVLVLALILRLVLGAPAGVAATDGGAAEAAFARASAAYEAAAERAFAKAAALMQAALMEDAGPKERRARWARDLGVWLERLGRIEEAAQSYLLAGRLGGDAWSFKAAGYAFLRARRWRSARAAFEEAAARQPADAALWEELGYLEKRLGRSRRAARAFARAMELRAQASGGAEHTERMRRLARERMFLSDRWQGAMDVIWRARSPDTAPVILSERSLTQSQISLRVSHPLGLDLGGPVRGFARLLAGANGRSLLPDARTLQAGVGLKWRPLSGENFVLAAERLIAIGRFARDDFLLRAAWSRGSDWLPSLDGHRPHFLWSIYLDGALIKPTDPDLLGNAQIRLGRQWFLGRHILRVNLAVTAFGQRDDFGAVSLLQVEPEVEIIRPLAPLFGPQPLRLMVFTVSFQKKVAGSSRNNRGLALRLSYRF